MCVEPEHSPCVHLKNTRAAPRIFLYFVKEKKLNKPLAGFPPSVRLKEHQMKLTSFILTERLQCKKSLSRIFGAATPPGALVLYIILEPMSNSFFRRVVVGVGLGEGHRSGCGAVENSRPSANGLNRLLRPNLCWLTVIFFKDRGDLQICPSLYLRRRRCWPPHPGQSLCCTSSFADCANSGSTSTI